MGFENIAGLWALTALIPFILIYLIRPKSVELTIPSIMFLMKQKGRTKLSSFLRKLKNNFLFFLQLLILLLLGVAAAEPKITLPYDVTSFNTVIIVDGSGSMGASYGAGTRLDKAVFEAKQEVTGSTSVIFAENTPLLLVEKGSKIEALAALDRLQPKATTTNLEDAMFLARDILGGVKGKIVVVSDFMSTGDDLLAAKKSLTSQGNKVVFIDVGNAVENVGFIKLVFNEDTVTAHIKNFDAKEKSITVKAVQDNKAISTFSLTLPAYSIGQVEATPPLGKSTLEIVEKDGFLGDNTLYLSFPTDPIISVLLISNTKGSSLLSALRASPKIEVETTRPPVIPEFTQDVVILHEVTPELILPGTFFDISKYLERGGSFILTAQNEVDQIKEINKLNLLSFAGKFDKTSVCVAVVNEFTKYLGENKCFTEVNTYYRITPADDAITIFSNDEKEPLLVMKDKAVYYGIIDKFSDFRKSPAYPIFWITLLDFLTQKEDIQQYNSKGGIRVPSIQGKVTTPSGLVESNFVLLDEAGYYDIDGRTLAVNLLDEEESNIAQTQRVFDEQQTALTAEQQIKQVEIQLDMVFMVLVMVLLFLELWYVKRRGEL